MESEPLNFTICIKDVPYHIFEWIAIESAKERTLALGPSAFTIQGISRSEIGKIRAFVHAKWGITLPIEGRVTEARDIFV